MHMELHNYGRPELQNMQQQLTIEKEIERMLADAGFLFSNDGAYFKMICCDCSNIPCVMWKTSIESIILFSKAHDGEEAQPNQ
jgi:hypothetical protein